MILSVASCKAPSLTCALSRAKLGASRPHKLVFGFAQLRLHLFIYVFTLTYQPIFQYHSCMSFLFLLLMLSRENTSYFR